MKKITPIQNNLVYSEILFKINKREVYSSQLAKELGKKQSTCQDQLSLLVKVKFLVLKNHPEKKDNIKFYSINWRRVNEEFFGFLLKKIDEYGIWTSRELKDFKEIQDVDDFKKLWKKCSEIKIFSTTFTGEVDNLINPILNNSELLNDSINNPYLTAFFKNMFEMTDKRYTLKDVFNSFNLNSCPKLLKFVEKNKSKDKYLENLLDIHKLLEHFNKYTLLGYRGILAQESVYRKIISDNNKEFPITNIMITELSNKNEPITNVIITESRNDISTKNVIIKDAYQKTNIFTKSSESNNNLNLNPEILTDKKSKKK